MDNQKTISQETETTVLELKGKFGPDGIMRQLFGGQNKKLDILPYHQVILYRLNNHRGAFLPFIKEY